MICDLAFSFPSLVANPKGAGLRALVTVEVADRLCMDLADVTEDVRFANRTTDE